MTLLAMGALYFITSAPKTQEEPARIAATTITRPGDANPTMLLTQRLDQLPEPFKSPKKFGVDKQPWEFPWITQGFAYFPQTHDNHLRFRVLSQERKAENDKAPQVARMLMTLWDEMFRRLHYDHSEAYNFHIVDVYLCWGGKAGGEQLFSVATENNTPRPVNTIYFYDLNSFADPVEMAREVAHEYGHAVLPAIGGFSAPETWANGFLGEKLFLRWVASGMATGKLVPTDAMGATRPNLEKWVAANVDPIVTKAAQTYPSKEVMKVSTAAGMDNYTGLALYAESILPDSVFARSLLLTGSTDAWDYPEAIVSAADEPNVLEITIPKLLANRPIWIPRGKGKLSGGKILKIQGSWTQIQAAEGKLTVTNRSQ